MVDEIDKIDRLLEQGTSDATIEPQFETWTAELRERRNRLELSPRSASTRKRNNVARNSKSRSRKNKNKVKGCVMKFKTQSKGLSAMPAWITDYTQRQKYMAERDRRRRLTNMKSTFQRFPEVRKHMYRQSGGRRDAYKPKICAQGERLRVQAWNSERLRKHLRKAAKTVLKCCDDQYINKTRKTQFLIELNRATMSSKVMLHRLIPNSDKDELAGIDGENSLQEMASIIAGEKSPKRTWKSKQNDNPVPSSPTTRLEDEISQHLKQKSSKEKTATLSITAQENYEESGNDSVL